MAIFTLGFDEKFALRALIRRNIDKNDLIVILTPAGRRDTRAEKAVNNLISILKQIVGEPRVERIEIPVEDFTKAVSIVRNIILSRPERPVYINISGSMRALVIETLGGALLSGVDAEIEVEFEDGSHVISFKPSHLCGERIDSLDMRILSEALKGIELAELAEKLGEPKPTIWRRVKKLEERNMITTERKGRKLRIKTTEKGMLYITSS
ncbi:MAG: CRISPR-associated CARF protein Csa3 [Sulfolobales archaeon]|nr:CRISPR-associated CARF protein Csa3 [Sulfolobales archaeon]